MATDKKRINHSIVLPSAALSKFLRKVVFDEDTFALFMENSVGALRSCGVEFDGCVTEDAMMRLRFLVVRSRDLVASRKIEKTRFEEVFGISVAHANLRDITLKAAAGAQADAAVDVYYAEQKSESNRGSTTDFTSGAVTSSKTDHYSTTKFDGKELTRPEDRFVAVPLLSTVVLGMVIAKLEVQLKELDAL